jgi:hypothetical protein
MNPLQRASAIRKATYLAAIVVLFTLSMVWRGVIPVPLGSSTAGAAAPFRWAQNHSIQSQASEDRLDLSDVNPNESDPDVSGSAMRLALLGSRGVVITGLWLSAIDKQKRNDFHELEQRVQAITKLQPNFITPWIFQSWNISYNVSVEMHGSGDMYYYIVRGIQLLAEGERRNKRSPDMRYQIAFYYQNKFGVSDQVEVLRCLYDLSCMPPSERNPARFEDPATRAINFEEFRKFCERHPHFVRRLRGEDVRSQDKQAREKLRAPRPEDVVEFLRANYQDLPCRYRKDALRNVWTDELAEPEPDRVFPVLPQQFNEGPKEAHPGIATPDDYAPGYGYFSAFKAARAWFSYSLLLLPPPVKDEQGKPLPGPTPPPGAEGHDPSRHRVPRMPAMIIFRQGAPRAQTYQAELEQKEGWFDGEGWRIEDWFPGRPEGVVVGTGRPWSLVEWQEAARMWKEHGEATGLSLDPARLERLRRQAGDTNSFPASPSPEQAEDESLRRRYKAAMAIQYYFSNRSTTNFPFFLASADAEQQPMTVEARKTLWQAEQARKVGEPLKAIRLYKDGLERWKQVLVAQFQKLYRPKPPDRGDRIEEETYEYELAYQRLLVQHDDRVRRAANEIARAIRLADGFAGAAPFQGVPFPEGGGNEAALDPYWNTANREELKWFVVENVGGADFSSPFVGSLAPDGTPWVQELVQEGVRGKQGVARGNQPQPPVPDPNKPAPLPPQP